MAFALLAMILSFGSIDWSSAMVTANQASVTVNMTEGIEASASQEPVSDNPPTIDNKDQPIQACTIEVSFSGPGVRNTQVGPTFGIGFSAKISRLTGDVAVRSIVQDPKPKGWLVEEWVSDHSVRNGEVTRQDTEARMVRLGRARPTREGDTVRWDDHPGTGVLGTQTYSTKRNFFLKAYNGDRYCELGFHLGFKVFNGQMTLPQWGKGLHR